MNALEIVLHRSVGKQHREIELCSVERGPFHRTVLRGTLDGPDPEDQTHGGVAVRVLLSLDKRFNIWWELGHGRRFPPDPRRENSENRKAWFVDNSAANHRRDRIEEIISFRPRLATVAGPKIEILRGVPVTSRGVILSVPSGVGDRLAEGNNSIISPPIHLHSWDLDVDPFSSGKRLLEERSKLTRGLG